MSFTIKDLINKYNICIGCGNKYQLNLYKTLNHNENVKLSYDVNSPILSFQGKKNYYELDNEVNINIKTHDFTLGNKDLKDFIENSVEIEMRCNKCMSFAYTNELDFDFTKNIIKPITLCSEYYIVSDGKNSITAYNDWHNKTTLLVSYEDYLTFKKGGWERKVPLMPKKYFKSKEIFLEKIKLYTTFQ